MKSPHEKLTHTTSISYREAKTYLQLCNEGMYKPTYYHRNKCKMIKEAFGEWLEEDDVHLYYILLTMIGYNSGTDDGI